ncbi:sulfotransferase family protein [Aquipuribacter sp. SD81]|uniref:sulfotransferase family protein n=1 Tax=Aquipuribacter sp. SD81 TaxID=3127703 RepID=UPI00301615E9
MANEHGLSARAEPVAADGAPGADCVLVAGNSRSGTTMLARMLGRHSAVTALQELHFVEEHWTPGEEALPREAAVRLAERLLHNAREWYHTPFRPGRFAPDAEAVVARCLVDRPDGRVPAAAVLTGVLAHEAQAAGRRVAVEQTPRNVFFLRSLLEEVPGAVGVVLVRDPRDVMLSQKNWWRRRFRGTTGVPLVTTLRQWADYHPLTTSLIWRGGARAGLRAGTHPRVVSLRFEDLVTEPAAELARVLDRVGLSAEPAMLDAPRISSSNAGDRGGTGVDPTVVGRWRDGLDRAEVWINQRVTAAEARELGYAPVDVGLPLPGLLWYALTWAPRTLLAVALNRSRTRSLVSSVRRRLVP